MNSNWKTETPTKFMYRHFVPCYKNSVSFEGIKRLWKFETYEEPYYIKFLPDCLLILIKLIISNLLSSNF